ncbi:FAD-binding oxidoreductase [Rhodospirillum rubrum]|uniref:D-lactate dehydrogenase (cytochrome) n=1 Tax=Rhodospirillum rubrum (strain ATCC 11170 / ATH 1.1.1 / DSM 467 / LMG 4362 / NCIMB 8255 / S1) TaxID=269796 RepID=Q2RWB4_RHORT|nr:FAD-linked oxidase C-terminal domain-containing protein [Rhodospirillum rubrum]ABC21581.1 D-lactate dehydrogenase (cytochrome) [Rhodospirillum rubrum ATCC 11170]AEO47267.1 D-lactate dehydrogenase [Rhodospirillum rubrum F11]MBK5955807.1 lactate dehydrogenase [Rhodospirillum rubrum]QXG81251.1 FAD-binding protein [Rhodospirillum rubrum]HAP99934.1 lactate dehydrogenase [Rhodospirillum rubrum]
MSGVIARSRPPASGLAAALAELSTLLGARLSTALALREHHSHDESHHAPALPDAVVFPETTAEVAAIARLCHAHRLPMVPFGAGSGLEGAVQATFGGVSIDLGRMDQVLAIHAGDMDATVQAGVRRQTLNALLRDTGLFFPIDPGADASFGGMAATRASGTNAVRFGTMRENVLGLTVVLADGQVVRTGGRARKSSAGYDLTRLFVGSEGTLGIITEVTLRLHPIPETAMTAIAAFPTPEAAVATVTALLQAGVAIGRVEFLDQAVVEVFVRHGKIDTPVLPSLLIEVHGSAAAAADVARGVAEIAEEGGASLFRWAASAEDSAKLWEARRLALGWARRDRPGSRSWPTDVCVPISALPGIIAATRADLADCPIPAFLFGHVGDGNFHCVFLIDPERPDETTTVQRLTRRMVERALAVDGTATGEHGIGLGKRDTLEAEHGAPAIALMRGLKATLDPHGLLNPGKIFPDAVDSPRETRSVFP